MRYPILLVPALALLLATCNGGEEKTQPTPSPSPAVVQPSPTAQPTPEPTPTPAPEPAVQRIAYVGTDGDLWIVNADGSGQQKLFDIGTELGESVRNLLWSPDGSKLALAGHIVSAKGETVIELPDVAFLAWSPGGDMFVASRPATPDAEPAVLIFDLDGNIAMEFTEGIEPSFSADGMRLAFFEILGAGGGFFPEVRGVVVDLRTAEVQPIDPDEDPIAAGSNGPPIFSPTNPSLLAFGDRLLDLNTGQEQPLPGRAVSWSPDGRRLLLEGAQIHDVETGTSIVEFDISLRQIGAFFWSLMRDQSAWSPASRLLATYDFPTGPDALGVLHIRDIATGDDKTVSIGASFPLESLEFSPDGMRLVISDPEGISLVDSDGTNLTPLAEGSEAAWQP